MKDLKVVDPVASKTKPLLMRDTLKMGIMDNDTALKKARKKSKKPYKEPPKITFGNFIIDF